ncbi:MULTISPECIES: hypothetical protein [unclassified Afipia]|uniref:hypothetical protein n=1 Tax=unclassified Afipia TaxID=2642050 RepID=UPI000410CA88|nr:MULTISPECIES: hypothetical protein [unclassified Afipia]
MTNGASIDAGFSSGQRRRLSLVVALVLGLLASLFHCTGELSAGDLAIAGSNATVLAMDFDGTTPTDGPDHKLPAHCGHCLSHVTAQPAFAVLVPSDIDHQAPPAGQEQMLASLAGLPLFKPPRA